MDQRGADRSRGAKPFVVVIAIGMIAALLYPPYRMFVVTPESRRLVANGFGVLVAAMAAYALFHAVRAVFFPGPKL